MFENMIFSSDAVEKDFKDSFCNNVAFLELRFLHHELVEKQIYNKQQKHKGSLENRSHFQSVANTTRKYIRELEIEIKKMKQEYKNAK